MLLLLLLEPFTMSLADGSGRRHRQLDARGRERERADGIDVLLEEATRARPIDQMNEQTDRLIDGCMDERASRVRVAHELQIRVGVGADGRAHDGRRVGRLDVAQPPGL